MKIGVLGTGSVAKIVAGKLGADGHDVKIGTRDVKATLARNEPDMAGLPPLRTWLETNTRVSVGTHAEAAKHGALVVNALSGTGALEGLESAGADALADKILIDISNPLDFSKGFPPSLTVSNTDSLGERIQKALPKTKVVKALNTVAAPLMVDPRQLAGGEHTMIVCGDDAAAKAEVTRILKEWFGWKDVIDLGDITNARGTEMWLPLWVRLYGALKTPLFGMKVVR
ncbi:MAG: NAD(P)-binding domain-containing protein [Labilithrix sp.]|nr:NAD(P)-binding domain-containing protein [Labilithrix sp.]MCW5812958.1 NAD(P)-binding domain-containing protein [Labilithrix sp.]